MAIPTHKPHKVYTRSSWAAAWVEVPYLYCNKFAFGCAPDTSDAVLEYDYGRLMQHGQITWATYLPLDLTDRYVKVAVEDGITWYGIVVETEGPRDGGQKIDGAEILSGTQLFQCRGLEYLLQRKYVDSSIVKDANAAGGETTIGRAIGFNLGAGLPSSGERQGNMSQVLGNAGSPVFASDLQQALEWTGHDILQYLLTVHTPRNQGDLDLLGWFTNLPISRQTLAGFKPTLLVEGKSLFDVLNELIDRRRLMSWWIYVDPANEKPEIRLFTFNPLPINLPDGQNIVENQNQVPNWNFDDENLVQHCVTGSDAAAAFDRVLGKGEPPGAVFTVEMGGGGGNALLETDWTNDQYTIYRTGGTGDAGYAALSTTGQMNANQVARTKDSVKKVFRYFRISPTQFTGTIGGSAVWPLDKNNTNVPLSFWLPGLRLRDHLPLRLEHDYTNPVAVTNAMKAASKWEYQRPFAYVRGEDGKYYFLDRPGRGESFDSHIQQASGRYWGASLRMMDDGFGIIVDANPAHLIAKNSFTPIDDTDAEDYQPDVDYNYLAATVFAEGDGRVTVQWPPQINVPADTLKELIIPIPNARRDYIVPGTTLDLAAGDRVQSLGGFVRDDTEYMLNVVRTAYEWYQRPRKSIQVTIDDLGFVAVQDLQGNAATIFLGSLILQIGSAANPDFINSAVTRITYDLRSGLVTYLTQFAELDLR